MDIKFSGSDANGFQFDQNAAPRPKKERKPRKSIGSKAGRIAVNALVTLLVGAVFFYLELPAINLHAEEFYGFALLLCITYCICSLLTSGFQGTGAKGYFTFVKKQCTVPFLVSALLIVTALIGALTSWVVLRAKDYQALLPIENGSFTEEIDEISYDRIPMLDKDSAQKLGDRKLGELADMVSQFEVSADYTQINYHGRPVRVTPLRYGDIIKWFNNRSKGLPAYLVIDMVTQNVDDLHERAGSHHVTHLHGELRKLRSSKNESLIVPIDGWEQKLDDRAPDGSLLRPFVVFFGEGVPMFDQATKVAATADLFVVIGTSLAVYPAAALVRYIRPDIPVFLVDPNRPDLSGIRNPLEYIPMRASEGVPELVDRLIKEYGVSSSN